MQTKLKLPIKKGDTVEVISGAHRGKKGEVLELIRDIRQGQPKIKVRGVRVQIHFDKKEGILKKEGFIDYSNVRLVSGVKEKKPPQKSSMPSNSVPPKEIESKKTKKKS